MAVSLDVQGRCANIVVDARTLCHEPFFEPVIEGCTRCASVHVVFMWIKGTRSPSSAHDGTFGCSQKLAPDSLLCCLDRLQQPIVGFCDNWMHPLCVHLLAACDLVVATRSAQFQVESLNLGANRAFKVGLVSSLVEDERALLSAHERLSEQMRRCSWPILKLAKTTLRNTRSSMLDISFDADKVAPRSFQTVSADSEPAKVHPVVPPPGLSLPENGDVRTGAGEADAAESLLSLAAHCAEHGGNDDSKRPSVRRGPLKRKDLVSEYSGHQGPITTLMVQNIPCRVTQEQLSDVIVNLGFGDKFDFLYVPTGRRSSMTGRSNLGYGFINFSQPEDAESFSRVFTNYLFEGTRSKKVSTVKPAHIQGLANNIDHFSRLREENLSHGLVLRAELGRDTRNPTPQQLNNR